MLKTVRVLSLVLATVARGCRDDKPAVRSDPPGVSASPVTPQMTAPPPLPSSATTSSAEPLPPPALADAGSDVDDAVARVAWVRAREAAGDLVRVPLVRRGPGWGCICPEYFIGASTISGGDQTTWIEPVFAPTAAPLPQDRIVIVEGYFTGKTLPFAPKTTEEYEKATLHELRVLRHRPVARDPNAEGVALPPDEAKMRVVLSAKDAHREKEAPADGKPFLLVALSVPMTEGAKATETAERRRLELVAKGFPAAEVIDTRLAPGLFCCHLAVVASRHATAREADTVAKEAKKNGISLLVRRGW